MNRTMFTARLTADPQLREVGELQICDLRVAIPRRRGRDGEDRGAVFIDVTTFGGLALSCGKYLAKGRQVAVDGRLELDEWAAQDGSSRRRHKVVAEQVQFLDAASNQKDGQPSSEEIAEDELAAQRARHDDAEQPVAA